MPLSAVGATPLNANGEIARNCARLRARIWAAEKSDMVARLAVRNSDAGIDFKSLGVSIRIFPTAKLLIAMP